RLREDSLESFPSSEVASRGRAGRRGSIPWRGAALQTLFENLSIPISGPPMLGGSQRFLEDHEVVAPVGVPADAHDVVHPGDRQVQHRAVLVVTLEAD